MSGSRVAGVRRFNRTVTQGVGALHAQYLARDRSLGEARVLWEIGPDGCEVRALRARLDLDSGYLSRLLRSLRGGRPTELKRMWVSPAARGLGVGRRHLAELEARALASGSTRTRLETNRALNEAIALYRASGYREVNAFNDEPYAHHWFEKRLT